VKPIRQVSRPDRATQRVKQAGQVCISGKVVDGNRLSTTQKSRLLYRAGPIIRIWKSLNASMAAFVTSLKPAVEFLSCWNMAEISAF